MLSDFIKVLSSINIFINYYFTASQVTPYLKAWISKVQQKHSFFRNRLVF